MSSNVKYLTFYENWRKNKKWCTPEEWYELEDIILQLRFDGIDTDPDTIENEKIAMIWNNIRPSILKSNRDKRYNDSKKNKQSSNTIQDAIGTEFNITPVNNNIPNNLENEIKAILSPENATDDNLYIQDGESGLNSLKMGKNNEFEIEDNIYEINNKEISENMGQCLGTLDELKAKNQDVEVIMQNWLEDDDNVKMYNRWVNALVQYKFNKTPENEEMALGADRKLMELCDILNIQNKNEYLDYVKEDIDYKIAIVEKNQRIA